MYSQEDPRLLMLLTETLQEPLTSANVTSL